MPINRRIGIIDIGSNSIRLVIYELNSHQAHRVIGEFKQSARLSQRIGPDNILHTPDIQAIVLILTQFKHICTANQVTEIRAAATAAIRNAANSQEIIVTLQQQSGLTVELLSGEDEARIGFLGMVNSLDISDGILVDIGGGSTEVTVFRQRERVRSISFPFGAVNTTRKFSSSDGNFENEQLKNIRLMVQQAIAKEPWIQQHPGLPLIGMGGTIRSLCKISQKKRKYSLPLAHNYIMKADEMDDLIKWLPSLPPDKRKKVDGLSKDRYDIIIPGMLILDALFQASRCTHYVISGAGLRDGLFQESFLSASSHTESLLEKSTLNMLGLHSSAPIIHLNQVANHATVMFDALLGIHAYNDRHRQCLQAAALLYRIGVSINYYQFAKHSFYLIAHSRLDGLSHREILLCACIASYKTKSKAQQTYQKYKDILLETDVDAISKLGTLLQLAAALDASETQAISSISAAAISNVFQVKAETKFNPSVECREIDEVQKDFSKTWGLKLNFTPHAAGSSFSKI
jgi:exopolyphosphatase/guanosine-5'-triphosphate,3'-diphosphate pyrophosphatase